MVYFYELNLRYFWMWQKVSLFIIFRLYVFVFLIPLFCDHQENEYKSCEIEINIYLPLLNHKKISKDLFENNIHTLQDLVFLRIYGIRAISLLFCDHQDTGF